MDDLQNLSKQLSQHPEKQLQEEEIVRGKSKSVSYINWDNADLLFDYLKNSVF